jgi:2-polyprenyl-3-methyl-5-hydroxy-6-metoxy-1,4-benzoquinol methylase
MEKRSDAQLTLERMEKGAPNYNAWLARRFNQYAGPRVLEVGAGIGTITAHLAEGRQRVVALEIEDVYLRQLRERFSGAPNVEVVTWETLPDERFDSIVLSNVLEHIEDDAAAVQRFAKLLSPEGKLIILVPALPALFGAMDEAVGHHRRYTRESLRAVLQENGFAVDLLEWMNLAGIPGWFLNSRLLRRRTVPPLQLRIYDRVAPLIARAESKIKLPIGMSLFCVASKKKPLS